MRPISAGEVCLLERLEAVDSEYFQNERCNRRPLGSVPAIRDTEEAKTSASVTTMLGLTSTFGT